jgi:hypothetical protein
MQQEIDALKAQVEALSSSLDQVVGRAPVPKNQPVDPPSPEELEDEGPLEVVPHSAYLEEQLLVHVGSVMVKRQGKTLRVHLKDADTESERDALDDYLEKLKQQSTDAPLFVWEENRRTPTTVILSLRAEEFLPSQLGWDAVVDGICWDSLGLEVCTAALSEYVEPR